MFSEIFIVSLIKLSIIFTGCARGSSLISLLELDLKTSLAQKKILKRMQDNVNKNISYGWKRQTLIIIIQMTPTDYLETPLPKILEFTSDDFSSCLFLHYYWCFLLNLKNIWREYKSKSTLYESGFICFLFSIEIILL